MANQKGISAQNRQKEFERKRRELRSGATPSTPAVSISKSPTDYQSWPIVRAYSPIEDVFRATGFGTAGIVRLSPSGKWFTSYFMISLREEGLKGMYGKQNTNEKEDADFWKSLGPITPAKIPSTPELAARYIWGAHAYALKTGNAFDRRQSARYFALVPPLPGRSNGWLQEFVGPEGLADPRLVEFLDAHPPAKDIPEGKEEMIWTTVTFSCSDRDAVISGLRKQNPEFQDQRDDDGPNRFTWTRAYPKNHWSPLSKLGGRQTLGSVEIYDDHLIAESKVLSMASILFAKLKIAFGDIIKLQNTTWKSSEDFIRESREEKLPTK